MPEPCSRWIETASRRRRHLVAVSGGADSVALLRLLHRAGFRQLVVCHLDHRLRGRASTADRHFVARLAAELGLPLECESVDVGDLARVSGESIETAARRARHEFFARCAARRRCPRVLLAHHADDQAETVLWNLLRGSHGLRGMRETQPLRVGRRRLELIRPLLGLRRAELREWLVAGGWKWREDASNRLPAATRNRLRHDALPRLAELTGRDPVAALVRAAGADEELRAIRDWAVAGAAILDPQGRIHLPRLRQLPAALQRACLFDFLRSRQVPQPDRALVERCLALADPAAAPALTLPGGRRLRRRRGRLFIDD